MKIDNKYTPVHQLFITNTSDIVFFLSVYIFYQFLSFQLCFLPFLFCFIGGFKLEILTVAGLIPAVYIIGIKDIFECFMMVLNYRSAVLKPEGLSALVQQIDSLKPS